MDFELIPPFGSGPVRLGMDRASATAALAQLDDGRADGVRPDSVTRRSGLGIGVGYGVTGLMDDRWYGREISDLTRARRA